MTDINHKMGSDPKVKFSLILATYERVTEVKNFLRYLNCQDYRSFELIVIDQNLDDRLISILEPYQKRFPLIHLYSEIGQSIARNIGILHSSGDILAFPDDDCWYPENLLGRVANWFDGRSEISGLSGCIKDEEGNLYPGFSTKSGFIRKHTVWGHSSATAIYLRSELIHEVGSFDEALGVAPGNIWVSSEDIDLIIRVVEKGYNLFYDPSFTIFHPNPIKDGYDRISLRAYGYGLGMGHVWRKHHFPLWYVAYRLSRSFGGSIISIALANFSKARYQWLSFRGKWDGWWGQ